MTNMTVRELIERLQQCPDQNSWVYFDCWEAQQVFPVQGVYQGGENHPCYILDTPS